MYKCFCEGRKRVEGYKVNFKRFKILHSSAVGGWSLPLVVSARRATAREVKLSFGETIEQLLKAYPSLNKESIYACIAFASESVKNEIVSI